MSQSARPREAGIDGLLIIDKPEGLTSHDVVARVRRIAATRRVGHTGTLDPMATGVLVLCLGRATRLIPYIDEMAGVDAKEYEARVFFGFETTTDDSEGEPRSEAVDASALTPDLVSAALRSLVGDLQQVPPAFSAKKVSGHRAYALARRGERVALAPVAVHVGAAELLELRGEYARVRFVCSRGTYIRALARDLGRSLGVGAHLAGLRRTRSGSATLDRAIRLDDLTPGSVAPALVPMISILDSWPSLAVDARGASDLRLGRGVSLRRDGDSPGGRVRVADETGRLVALCALDGYRITPFCVF